MTPEIVTLFTTTFLTLFVIMDPPGTVPVFLALTSSMSRGQRIAAARQAILVAFGVIMVFTLFGRYIFDFLHVSVPAFQASGGLLLLLVALDLLTGKAEEHKPTGNGVNVALVPLGTPLLAGPGAIVASMLAVENSDRSPIAWGAICLAIIVVHGCLYLSMRFAGVIHRVLGDGGVTVVTRLAGMLLAAISVQLIADAVIAFVASA